MVVLYPLYCNLSFPHCVLSAVSLPHPLLLQYPLCHLSRPSRAESRDAQAANRAGVLALRKSACLFISVHLSRCTCQPQEISVITYLLDATAFPAEYLLSTYQMSARSSCFPPDHRCVFSSEPDPLVAAAVLFQLSVCLLLYNTLQVLLSYLSFHQNASLDYLQREVVLRLEARTLSLYLFVEKESLLCCCANSRLSLVALVPASISLVSRNAS